MEFGGRYNIDQGGDLGTVARSERFELPTDNDVNDTHDGRPPEMQRYE
jgi:hypothetical protein